MYETMEQLRNLPQQCMQEDFLVHEVGLASPCPPPDLLLLTPILISTLTLTPSPSR